eukprot:1157324-Pelagomonas_calceolata.AAC.5
MTTTRTTTTTTSTTCPGLRSAWGKVVKPSKPSANRLMHAPREPLQATASGMDVGQAVRR